MIYSYWCDRCEQGVDIYKTAKEIDTREFCDECDSIMSRQFVFQGQMSVPNIEPHYNPAFGKIIHSKQELKDTVRQHNDKHGTDLQEVGNERVRAKKRERFVNAESAAKELYGVLKK